MYVVMYLVAIVAANVSVSLWGPVVTIPNAFLFIGLNLTSRDKLHDMWGGHLKRNMALLILAGSILSAMFGAGRIALASGLAFAASETADALVYHWRRHQGKLMQVNQSNLVSAGVDSLVFPVLAFGFPILWWVVGGQWIAKVAGGAIWSLWLFRR